MKKWYLLFIAAATFLGITVCEAQYVQVSKAEQKEKEKEKPRPTATIRVTTNPAGANVLIANKRYGKSPLSGKFPIGFYVIRAEMPGYESTWKGVHIEKDKVNEISISLKPITSSILLVTKPNISANVTFNGKKIGQAPIVIRDLKIGKYTAEISAPGYFTARTEWDIDSVRPKKVTVELKENTGVIKVLARNVPRGARVKINGKDYGLLPYERRVEQGEYSIEVNARGYAPFKQDVSLIAGKTAVVSPRMNELPGQLTVHSVPQGANVFINGKAHGPAPVTVTLRPGKYNIRLTKANYDPATATVQVAPGAKPVIRKGLSSSLGSVEFVTIPAGVTYYLDNGSPKVTVKDPKSKGYSKVVRINGLQPGKHTLKFVHKRAKRDRIITVDIKKNKNFRIEEPVELWIPNAQIHLKVGSKYEGRIVRETADEITFEYSPRSRANYKKAELKRIEWLSEEE